MANVQQACAIPCRRVGRQWEFCLITTSSGRWAFPKGFLGRGETVQQAALKEAAEEAGVEGRILGEPLGTFRLFKEGKSYQVCVVLMQVTRCHDNWPETAKRQRCWVTARRAYELLGRRELQDFLDQACALLRKLPPGMRSGVRAALPEVAVSTAHVAIAGEVA